MTQDSNDADARFLQMMIPHHQKAVAMAAKEITNGASPEVKAWAMAIFIGQAQEIKKFREWLESRGLPVKGGNGGM